MLNFSSKWSRNTTNRCAWCLRGTILELINDYQEYLEGEKDGWYHDKMADEGIEFADDIENPFDTGISDDIK